MMVMHSRKVWNWLFLVQPRWSLNYDTGASKRLAKSGGIGCDTNIIATWRLNTEKKCSQIDGLVHYLSTHQFDKKKVEAWPIQAFKIERVITNFLFVSDLDYFYLAGQNILSRG